MTTDKFRIWTSQLSSELFHETQISLNSISPQWKIILIVRTFKDNQSEKVNKCLRSFPHSLCVARPCAKAGRLTGKTCMWISSNVSRGIESSSLANVCEGYSVMFPISRLIERYLRLTYWLLSESLMKMRWMTTMDLFIMGMFTRDLVHTEQMRIALHLQKIRKKRAPSKGAFRLDWLSGQYGLLIPSRKLADAMSRLSFRGLLHCSLSALQLVKHWPIGSR